MIVSNEQSVIGRFLCDESNAVLASSEAVTSVYFPESEQDIVEAVRAISAKGEKITVSGGGTGITGSRVPVCGGAVISMERMTTARHREGCKALAHDGPAGRSLIYLDEAAMVAHVPPGISISELAAILPRGYMYPPDPTETAALIGGTVATNATGARCFSYGPTRRWVRGLRIVLADGETLDVERGQSLAGKEGVLAFASITGKKYRVRIPDYTMPEVKNAAGLYSKPGMDLIDLFIGSEGILGIISEISIGLIKLKKEPVAVLAFFNCESNALAYVSALRGMKERGVISVEYFGSNALDFIRPEFPALRQNLGAAVLCEAEAGRLDLMAEISALLERHGAVEDWCAATSGDRRDMKEFRHSLPEAVNLYLKQHDSHKISTDFVVPEPAFPEMMGRYRDAERKFRAGFRRQGAHCVLFGHIGDCHLHLNFITATEAERAYAKELHLDLAKAAVSLGGTISGEHGVGKKTVQVGARQAPYLELMYGRKGIEEISRVKGALDPGWLLNPGNMVPRKT